ncbi:MAG TPA: hypothetical protein VND98_11505 [Solirubrobacterales bacterium]|nr:hypothetical protein [Solirubrobacterales bacterium]
MTRQSTRITGVYVTGVLITRPDRALEFDLNTLGLQKRTSTGLREPEGIDRFGL